MRGTISVEAALKRGDRMLKYPTMALFLGLFFIGFVVAAVTRVAVYWGMLAGFVAGAVIGTLYAGYMTTRWRIWAFGNVTDVYELKKAAITEKYIPKDGSWQEKLEVRTAADKEQLAQIQQRFNEPYVFSDDLTIPEETQIFTSKAAKYIIVVVTLLVSLIALYQVISRANWLMLFFVIIPVAFGIWQYRRMSDPNPQIIVNSDGIQTATSTHTWADISSEEVLLESYGKDSRYYLDFQFPGGAEHLSIQYLDITPRRLNHLLTIYRHRYEGKGKRL